MANAKVPNTNKLQAKDLINVGVFTALYIVAFFVTGMIGYIPIFMLLIPALAPLVCGIIFMLFLPKVEKFGMVTIMGIILALFMFITGHPWPILIIGVVCAVLADLIMKSGNYKSWGKICIGYIVFSEILIGLMIPIFFMKDTYLAGIRDGYGDTYVDTLTAITPMWVFPIMIVLVAVGALLGAYLGKLLLKKHFKRAGIA